MQRTEKKAPSILMSIIASLWLGVFPLVSKFSYAGFTKSKWIIMIGLTAATMLFTLLALLFGGARQTNWKHLGRWLGVGCFCWMGLSALFGAAASRTNDAGELIVWIGSGRFEGMGTQLCYLAIFLCMSLVRPRMKAILAVAAAGMAAFFTVIALQYAGQNPLGLYPGFPFAYNTRTVYEFQGTIGQIDMVSGFLSMTTPLFLGYWVCRGGRCGWYLLPAGCVSVLITLMIEVDGGRLALLLAAGLLVMLMLCKPELRPRGLIVLGLLLICVTVRSLTGLPWVDGLESPWNAPARSDVLLPALQGDEPVIIPWNPSLKKFLPAILGGLLMLLSLPLKRHSGSAMSLRAVVALCAALVVLVMAVLAFAPIPTSMGFVWEIHEMLCGRPQDSFGSERVGIWRCALELSRQHLLFGWGPDTFYPVNKDFLAETGRVIHQNFDNPHNLYLAILMQNGLPALLLYLGCMVYTILQAARTSEGKPLAAAALCYLLQGFFTFSICIVTPIFWALLGMAVVMAPDEKARRIV